jgi:DNA polymerase I-like protein with 3'-5' exonuclease and polymerase domains
MELKKRVAGLERRGVYMDKQNNHSLEKEVEKKYKKREKRRKAKMKVSGAGVKRLQKIISGKSIK